MFIALPCGLRAPQKKVTGIKIYDLIGSPQQNETKISMPVSTICHKYVQQSLSSFNKARMKSLLSCSDALAQGRRLTLTAIGRNLAGNAKVKHKIKRVDRLLGNSKIHAELTHIYQAIAKNLYSSLPYLIIAVDWSGCCRSDYHLLRASLVVDGRSISIYNMIVETKDLETQHSHALFLKRLAKIIDTNKKVYIISDGGYITPWFSEVSKYGWHFVGRLRGTIQCQVNDGDWQPLKNLHQGATGTPSYLGEATLGKQTPTSCKAYLHLYKGKNKGRTGKSKFTKDTKMYQNLAKEPWLIASSDSEITSAQAITIYEKRMQIEQNFRDDKSPRYGFSWRFSKSLGVERMSVLCLIACIATISLWFVGFEGEQRKLHYQFQANTTKDRRVLSFLSLATNIIRHLSRKITAIYIRKSKEKLIHDYDSLMLQLYS